MLTITERDLSAFVAALAPRGEDLLTYLAALSALLDADSIALGRNLDAGDVAAFLRGEGAATGICIASNVSLASERAFRASVRVLEQDVRGRHLLYSWLPGHEHYFR